MNLLACCVVVSVAVLINRHYFGDILMLAVMPGQLNNLQGSQAVQTSGQHPLGQVLLSAHDQWGGRRAGTDGSLVSPFSLSQLLSTVHECLGVTA